MEENQPLSKIIVHRTIPVVTVAHVPVSDDLIGINLYNSGFVSYLILDLLLKIVADS